MTEINLTPDFTALFERFIKDAEYQGNSLKGAVYAAIADDYHRAVRNVEMQAAILRVIQRYLAPITVAANCATDRASIERLRGVMADTLAAVDTAALALETEAAEDLEALDE